MDILIIDDTRSVHAFVKNLLSNASGIQVMSAMNGQEGWYELQKGKVFDLILLDWEMPIMDGPTTLIKIKSSGVSTPVIMMTTKNEPEDIERILGLGASEYLMKPFTVDILFEKIGFVLGRSIPYAV